LPSSAKAGIGINLKPLTLGATVATQPESIWKWISRCFFVSGVDTNVFESNYQDDIKSRYNSSWVVGAGGAYRLDKFKLHISAEWYDAIEKFNVLDTESYLSQSSGEQLTNDLTHEAESVINYGLGLDYYANDVCIFLHHQ
jgi:hypothetical protein